MLLFIIHRPSPIQLPTSIIHSPSNVHHPFNIKGPASGLLTTNVTFSPPGANLPIFALALMPNVPCSLDPMLAITSPHPSPGAKPSQPVMYHLPQQPPCPSSIRHSPLYPLPSAPRQYSNPSIVASPPSSTQATECLWAIRVMIR